MSFNPSLSPNMTFTEPSDKSPQLRTLLAYVDALHSRDFGSILAVFDEHLEHRILPQSLGRPVLNKKQYGEYLAGIMPLLKSFQVTLHEVIEAGDTMTVHGTSKGESVTGTPYSNEYTLIIHFSPPRMPARSANNGDFEDDAPPPLPLMRYVKEFIDSATSTKFFSEERAKAKARAQSQGINLGVSGSMPNVSTTTESVEAARSTRKKPGRVNFNLQLDPRNTRGS